MGSTESNSKGLDYDLLTELWNVVVRDALVSAERNVIFKWVKDTAESSDGFPMPLPELIRFFKDTMIVKEEFQTMTSEGFDCFQSIFLSINEKLENLTKMAPIVTNRYVGYGNRMASPRSNNYNYDEDKNTSDQEKEFLYRVNIEPNQIEGIQNVWNIALNAGSEEVAEKARNLLNELYLNVNINLEQSLVPIRQQYLDKCIQSLKETLERKNDQDSSIDTLKCLRCLSLLTKMLDESEKAGVGDLKSHSGLIKGELLTFIMTNDVSWGLEIPKKIEMRMHSNMTIFELRGQAAHYFKVTWDQIKLTRSQQREIKDSDNGKTLSDLRIRNGENLTASKRYTRPIEQANLVDSDGSLNPLVKKIFIDWFKEFSEDSKMNSEQCAAFINSCTNDGCKADDKRVKDVFSNNDHDRDGFLSLNDFLEFYTTSSRHRPHVVWSNLHSRHYRNDLKKASEVETEKVHTKTLPRFILSTNNQYFPLLFSLLDHGGKLAVETWKLLNRLPTSPQTYVDIVQLTGVREAADKERDWKHVLDPSSSYKLLYALQLIEYLMENEHIEANKRDEGAQEERSEELLETKDPKFEEHKKNWQADFISYGGLDYLFKIFHRFVGKDHNELGTFDKNILSFILKILSNYLSATFAGTVSNIYRCLSLVQLFHLDLDFIQNYINTDQKKGSNPALESEKSSLSPSKAKEVSKPSVTVQNTDTDSDVQASKYGPHLPGKDIKADEIVKEENVDVKIEEPEDFRVLVERLRGELGNHILSTIDLKEMIQLISELGRDILRQPYELESEDRMILEYSLTILTSIFLYDNETIKYFFNLNKANQNSSDSLILEGIFCSRSFNVRNYFSHAIYVLSRYTGGFENAITGRHYIKLFLNNLPSSKDNSKEDCNQYFELLCKLIEETYNDSQIAKEDETLNFEDLIRMISQRIKEHVSTEDRCNFHIVDKTFIGLLHLCEKILLVKPELKAVVGGKNDCNLVEEVFNVCLFHIQDDNDDESENVNEAVSKDLGNPSKQLVKCKSAESRRIAYRLLLTLCKGHQPNLLILLKSLDNLMKSITKLNRSEGWNYSPSSDTKSLYGYVGIRNLRCICYMNAMLQQFFMTPTFRYGILAADDKKEPNPVKNDEGQVIDDNVLHQFQQMFGFLEASDRQDYNPFEFCFSFKDHAGQPVNVSVQQDTQEFLNMIFDKLENGLKETPFKNILEGVYGGKTSNQTICHGCNTMREKEDLFYNLSVEVKNMKSIYDSFEKFVTGEIIEGLLL